MKYSINSQITEVMASKLLQLVLTQLLVTKALSSLLPPYGQKQYGPASRPGLPKFTSAYSSSPYSSNYKRFYAQNYPQQYYPSYPKAPEIPTPQIQQVVQQIPQIEQKCESKLETPPTRTSGKIDSHVLNNLAIALQLLIVNNILNNPLESHEHIPAISDSIMELVLPNKLGSQPVQMPNSKFLGTATFGQDISQPIFGTYGIASGLPSPRPGVNLMSPYDAIAKSSPFSESLVSSFVAKNDFISPYASIAAADNDLFSMSDLFM